MLHASSTMKKQAVDSFEILVIYHGVKIQNGTIIYDACQLPANVTVSIHSHWCM
jgi:hypothetical protein